MFNKNNDAQITGDNNLVIQDANGSTITVHLNNPEEIREFFINFQNSLDLLPIEILKRLQELQNLETPPVIGANLYLTLIAQIGESAGFGGRRERDALFGLTLTSLTKENRFFNTPYFKTNPGFPIPGVQKADTFIMFHREGTGFPVKLEYGQPISLTFEIKPLAWQYYQQMAEEGAYIQAFVTTTLGELYSSNQYSIPQFIEDYRRIMGS